MPWVDHTYKFIFFAAPATGSSAMLKALRKTGSGAFLPDEDVQRNGKLVAEKKHGTPRQLERAGLLTPELRDYFWFSGVRNPFAWYVAKFLRNQTKRLKDLEDKDSFIHKKPPADRERYIERLKKQAEMSFAEFLDSQLDRKKGQFELQKAFHEGMSFFLHQENLDADFDELKRRISLPAELKLRQYNVTGAMEEGQTYADFYDDAMVKRVYEINAPFFERFPEYSFAGLKT